MEKMIAPVKVSLPPSLEQMVKQDAENGALKISQVIRKILAEHYGYKPTNGDA